MATYSYVRASGIRKLVKESGKRCGGDFLHAFDAFVYEKVNACIKQGNGSLKTLDGTVANFILRK